MPSLNDVIAYICAKYPHKTELSDARLTKMVYLADWRSSIVRNKQITSIKWIFNHYGPYVPDVIDAARNDSRFKLAVGNTMFGNIKMTVSLVDSAEIPILGDEVEGILDHVIEKTKNLSFNQFLQLVYGTYPIINSNRFDELNLVKLAKEQKAVAAD